MSPGDIFKVLKALFPLNVLDSLSCADVLISFQNIHYKGNLCHRLRPSEVKPVNKPVKGASNHVA